jgi:NAD+ kinase
MVAATPTGSTANALSGGGPILHPDLDALVLVPICPHTLSDRPLVLSADSRIELVVKGGQAQVAWDGQRVRAIQPGDRLQINRSAQVTTLLHPPQHDYFALLRSKLQWGRSQDGSVPR